MSHVRLNLERLSSRLTKTVGKHWGEEFPFYYVMEYPKSGGTWLAQMIADYLQIPRPNRPVFPIGFESVIHGHWSYSPRLRRVFYLVRDGRDVAVSSYFRVIGETELPPYAASRSYYRRRFPSLFVEGKDPRKDVRELLPHYIREWSTHPGGTRYTWSEHVSMWAGRPHVLTIRYEDLLEDSAAALARAIPIHSGQPIDSERLLATVEKFTFERQAGRKRGDEVAGAILRKGIAGDWRNYFTREAARSFDEHCGRTLVSLGYEKDSGWIMGLPD